MFEIVFITQNNKDQYVEETLNWLKSDFQKKGEPKWHFWHNRDVISTAFSRCDAMVVLNDQKCAIGYMVWHRDSVSAGISIVEVKKEYRRQGICKQMLSAFSDEFPEIAVLTATVLEQSKTIFRKMGWKGTYDINKHEVFFKTIRPCMQPLDTLPNGRVIAVCSGDFYKIKVDLKKYQDKMKYFQIDLGTDDKLQQPIITEFYYEGYVGIYLNKNIVLENKTKYLFRDNKIHLSGSLLVIDKMDFKDSKLLEEAGFFVSSQPQKLNDKEETNTRPKKKHHPELKPAFFQPDEKKSNPKTLVFSDSIPEDPKLGFKNKG